MFNTVISVLRQCRLPTHQIYQKSQQILAFPTKESCVVANITKRTQELSCVIAENIGPVNGLIAIYALPNHRR